MKTNFFLINGFILLLTFATNCFAATNKSVNSVFSINLPENMKLTSQNDDDERFIYQFVFESPKSEDDSQQQIRITAVGHSPKHASEFNNWEITALGTNIANFIVDQHFDPEKHDTMAKKPEKIKLGKQKFTAASLTFDDMQTYFLVATRKGSTYNITLVSKDKDPKNRKLKMQKLLDAVRNISYFGAKKSSDESDTPISKKYHKNRHSHSESS